MTPYLQADGVLTVMLVFCIDNNLGYYYTIPVSFVTPEPFPGIPLNLPNIVNLGDAHLADGYLFVQNLGSAPTPMNPMGMLGGVYAYQLNFSDPNYQTVVAYFDAGSLGNKNLNVTSFSLQIMTGMNFTKMYLSAGSQYIYNIDFPSNSPWTFTS
jgi:hypothetical protein